MAGIEIAPGVKLFDRAAWGVDSSIPRLGNKVSRAKRSHVIIHHTVMVDSDSTPNVWETQKEIFRKMRQLQTIRPTLGLDVPYNFVCFLMKSGELFICEGRGEDRTGAHTKGHNTTGIGISFCGNFHDFSVNTQTLQTAMVQLSLFLGWLRYSASHPDYGTYPPMANLGSLRPSGRAVFTHRDVKPTDCPGRVLSPFLKSVEFTPTGPLTDDSQG